MTTSAGSERSVLKGNPLSCFENPWKNAVFRGESHLSQKPVSTVSVTGPCNAMKLRRLSSLADLSKILSKGTLKKTQMSPECLTGLIAGASTVAQLVQLVTFPAAMRPIGPLET